MKNPDDETRFAERLKRLSGERYERVLVGREIAKLRKGKNMAQKELAHLLKTKQSAVARIETGRQNITLRTLVKIAGIFRKKLQIRFR